MTELILKLKSSSIIQLELDLDELSKTKHSSLKGGLQSCRFFSIQSKPAALLIGVIMKKNDKSSSIAFLVY